MFVTQGRCSFVPFVQKVLYGVLHRTLADIQFAEAARMTPEPGVVRKVMEVVIKQRVKEGKLLTRPSLPFHEDIFDMSPVSLSAASSQLQVNCMY